MSSWCVVARTTALSEQIDELGQAMANLAAVVQAGMVVFLPSYGFLDTVLERWKASGLYARLGSKKKVRRGKRGRADFRADLHRAQAVQRDG